MGCIKLNKLLVDGGESLPIKVGMKIDEVEDVLEQSLGDCVADTADLKCYVVELKDKGYWSVYFDRTDVCFELRLNLNENSHTQFFVDETGLRIWLNEDIAFDRLVSILSCLGVDWLFDVKRMYLQTACLLLSN